ncbi:protein kinase [Streptomyces sp. NPDC018338]|uniref:protein kinase domain-containing protein n=1 Tax=Streptomyces sp. NPDC018338 TaxID=3157192 RepID=UPI0033CA09B3
MALRDNDPREIGGYALLDRLGAGGMGTVFLARAESGRPVALKVVHEQFAADTEFRTRFRQEVRAARRVSGAFTAPVVDADPDAARPWMATTYVPGQTLRSRVESEGTLSGAELRHLAVGLVEALRDMHQVRVIHRDLKPDNVLLTEDGPRVIDFGISRAADHQTLTVTGRILGTPPFMSPEQLSAPHRVTPASDVFSLGAVLVYATTGRGPFDAGSPYMTAYNVVHEPPEVAELSGTVREIVQWCLAKEPGERPGPEDLLAAFRQAPEEEWGARPAAPTVPSAEADATTAPVAKTRSRRRPVLVALATAVALLAGTGAYVWWPDGRAPGGTSKAGGPSVTPSTSRSPQAGRVPDASVLAAETAYAPVYGGDPGTTHAYADSPARRPAGWRAWAGKTGLEACVFVDASLVCVAPHEVDTEGRLVRIDAATGLTVWSVPVAVGDGGTPAVVGETIAVSSKGGLRAFALADGSALWTRSGEDTIGRVTSAGGNVYGGTFDGTVVALSAATGEVRWRRQRLVGGIGYPRVRISGDRVHVLTASDGETEARRVVSLRVANGSTAVTTTLQRPCDPWDLTVLPPRGVHRVPFVFLLCRASESGGHLLQRSGEREADLDLSNRGIASATIADHGMYGVISAQRPDHSFAQLDDGTTGGPLWQVPLGLACGPADPPPVVTGQRAYVVCGSAGAVIDLTRHTLAARFLLPSGVAEAGGGDAGVLVAGGILYVRTEKGWASLDPYATPV